MLEFGSNPIGDRCIRIVDEHEDLMRSVTLLGDRLESSDQRRRPAALRTNDDAEAHRAVGGP